MPLDMPVSEKPALPRPRRLPHPAADAEAPDLFQALYPARIGTQPS